MEMEKSKKKTTLQKEPLHTTLTLDVLMRLTHMNRISTKQEVEEFLFRLAFLMDLKNIIAKTGEDDFLALYSFRKKTYRFTTGVLEKYIGFECTGANESFLPRESFFRSVFISQFSAMMTARSYGIGLPLPKELTRETESGTQILSPDNNPENVKGAELIAGKLMKKIPVVAFSGKNREFLIGEMSFKPYEDYLPQPKLLKPGPAEYKKRDEYNRQRDKTWSEKLGNEYLYFLNSWDWETDVIRKGGKCGLRTALGEIILPPLFENLKLLSSRRGKAGELKKGDRVVAMKDGKWGVVEADGNGTWLIEPEYDYIGYPNNITFFLKDGKWSIMNISTRECLVKDCDEVPAWNGLMFMNRVGTYKKKGKWGVIMDWGAMTKPLFDDVSGDTDDGPVEVKYNGKNGFINEKNEFTEDEDEAYYLYSTD